MKKKLIALLLFVVIISGVAFSCAACDWGDGLEITFYHTMNKTLQGILEKHIAKFEAMYPGIKIKHQQVGGYEDVRDQIRDDIQTGQQPNIAYCYPDHVAIFNKAKAVATLDSFIDSTEKVEAGKFGNDKEYDIGLSTAQKEDFITSYYNEGKSFGDDKMYTMPFAKSTEVFFYNKDFFDDHKADGLELPDHWFSRGEDDTTSMEYVCAKIKEIDVNSIPLGYDSSANWFITMTEQLNTPYTSATGENYVFNTTENRDFAKKFNEWYHNGWVTTKGLNDNKYTSKLFTITDPQQTKCYMVVGSTAGANNQTGSAVDGEYPFEVGITSIPQEDASNPKVISQGPSVCIFKKSNQDEVLASWLFVKYLTTNVQFQAEFSMASGYVPVIKSVGEDAAYKAHLALANGTSGITALAAKVCLEQADYYYTSPVFDGSSEARDEVDDLLIKCMKENKTGAELESFIADAFANAITKLKH